MTNPNTALPTSLNNNKNNILHRNEKDGRSEALLSSSYLSSTVSDPELVNNLTSDGSSTTEKMKDRIGSLLFFIHIVIVIVVVLLCVPPMLQQQTYTINTDKFLTYILPWYLVSISFSMMLTFITIRCFVEYRFGVLGFRTLLVGSIILNGSVVGYCFYKTLIEGQLLYITVYAIWLTGNSRHLWSRASFLVVILEISITILHQSKHMLGTLLFYAYTYLILQGVWMAPWVALVIFFLSSTIDPTDVDVTRLYLSLALFIFLSLSVIWVSDIFGTILRATIASVVGDLCLSSSARSPLHQQVVTTEARTTSQLVHQAHYRILRTSFGNICTNFFTSSPDPIDDRVKGKRWYRAIFIGLDESTVKDSIINQRNFFMSNHTLSEIMNFIIELDMNRFSLSIGLVSTVFILAMMYGLDGYLLDDIYFLIPLFSGYAISTTAYRIVTTTGNTILICYYRYPGEFEIHQPQLFTRISEAIRLFPTSIIPSSTSSRLDGASPSTELVW